MSSSPKKKIFDLSIFQADDDFLLFLLLQKMKAGKTYSREKLLDLTEDFEGPISRKKHLIESFSNRGLFLVESTDDHYKRTSDSDYISNVITKFESEIFLLSWDSDASLIKKISEVISKPFFNVVESLAYSLSYYKKHESKNTQFYSFMVFKIYLKLDDLKFGFDKAVNSINENFENLSFSDIGFKSEVVNLLISNGINSFTDLQSLTPDALLFLFSSNPFKALYILDLLKNNFLDSYRAEVLTLQRTLEARELEILSQRYGLHDGIRKTLEEVGISSSVTRERIRQIEAKAISKLKANSLRYQIILRALFFSVKKPGENFVSVEEMAKFVRDITLTRWLLFLYEFFSTTVHYDSRLDVIFDSEVENIESICQKIISAFGQILLPSDYEALNSFEKRVINTFYRNCDGNYYLLRGVPQSDVIKALINKVFPNGYKIAHNETYQRLMDEYKKIYGENATLSNKRALGSCLGRWGFILVDRGTYKDSTYCANLPEPLFKDICVYVLLNKPTVMYQSIFAHFENDLAKFGVNNQWYMKGLLDPIFQKEGFFTNRDYVRATEVRITNQEAIIQTLRSFKGAFSMEDIREKFEGVKEYIIMNIVYQETENGLIFLYKKRFAYINKVRIEEETLKDLKNFIEDTFVKFDTEVLSSQKLFARLSLFNPVLLEKLVFAETHFALFSIIRYCFEKEYFYQRPFIAKEEALLSDNYGLISNFVNKLDMFNKGMVEKFIQRMSFRDLYSYLEFMENQSDDFVQINADTMVKKEKLQLSKENLQDFSEVVALFFSRYNMVDTKTFNGYALLPKFPYKWNKYFFVGVIRSYFPDKFDIKNTTNFYNTTDFEIRRI